MAFNLGNFAVKEIIFGVGQNFDDEILYVLDQLTSASIEVSSDPVEITDKHGNVVRTIYNSKTATFSATSALLSPAILNVQSGSEAEYATADLPIDMPEIIPVAPGATLDVTNAVDAAAIKVIGMYGNGANSDALAYGTDFTVTEGEDGKKTITMPAKEDDGPTQYVVVYDAARTNGMVIKNTANTFPNAQKLKLYCAIMDPCKDTYRAAVVLIPNFTPAPSVTINLDSKTTETDFSGNINVDYCSCDKMLYYIYFLDEDAVVAAACA